ncbi:hypothetical protein H0X32_01060 [Patescibacteria group bacterium]|nr:hypothetical protein [Patescibacteria group bacterium]
MDDKKIIALVIGGVILFVGFLFLLGHFSQPKPVVPIQTLTDSSALPGMQVGNAPWAPELSHLLERLKAIHLPALSQEGTALHIHQHLDLYINGKSVAVPPEIGISTSFISPIHVHDTSGIIHVESPTVQTFTLGQFFDIWGVRFTSQCIGGYCANANSTLAVYVDGKLYSGDPRQLSLAPHQEIVITYGTDTQLPNPIPSTFAFPAGY